MKTKMNNKVKALLMACCAVLLVFASVLGTLAYLTDTTEKVTNTFTVGNVEIKLDEAKVDPDTGKKVNPEVRISGPQATNSYKILPGRTIDKDPTVTVNANSENCYVRMKVTVVNYDKMVEAFRTYTDSASDNYYYLNTNGENMILLHNLVQGWDANVWEFVNFDTTAHTYEFRYHEIVTTNTIDQPLVPLFTTVTIPGVLNNTQYAALETVQIEVEAHAIQSEGFADANAAWAAFPTT